MARPRESDERRYPEQAERFRRAMWWARVESAAQLCERMGGAMKQSTINNRIQGNTELRPIETPAFAAALGVARQVLEPGGPMLPDPSEAHFHAVVTGESGHWTLTVVSPNVTPQAIEFDSDEPPSLPSLLRRGADDDRASACAGSSSPADTARSVVDRAKLESTMPPRRRGA